MCQVYYCLPKARKSPETAKAKGGTLFDATKLFRPGSCKLALGELLADGQEHEIAELKELCNQHKLKTYQVINFAAMRLRSAGLTVTRSGGTIQVSA